MPSDRDILNDVDSTGTDSAALGNRLNAALNVQRVVTKRVTAVNSVWANPGPPNAPQLLTDLITEAKATIAAAESIQRKIIASDG